MELNEIKKIYFVGIGGIGMSALARYFNGREVEVFGYDKTETVLTKKLVEEGMQIHYEEDISLVPEGIDLVVFTPAVPQEHQELRYFRDQGLPVYKRAEVLGMISRSMRTVAIAGTHGKTTTSSILTYLLRVGGIDCTAFLGGIARNFESNFVEGSSDWMVVEADEYDRSFLQLSPDIAVILSVDPDHLDIYGDAEQIVETGFRAFAGRLKTGGQLWLNQRVADQFSGPGPFRVFGLEAGDYRAEHIRVEDGFFVFDYSNPDRSINGLRLALPGRHNVENATAALSVALELGVSDKAAREALATFGGIKRRFEIVYRDEQRVFIDDYAHHPTELQAAIRAAKDLFPGRRIMGLFQPHLYSRTRDFAGAFAKALDQLDEAWLMDIYPARERPIEGVDAGIIFRQMSLKEKRRVTKQNLMDQLKEKNIDVLLTLGAGDIDTLTAPIADLLASKTEFEQ